MSSSKLVAQRVDSYLTRMGKSPEQFAADTGLSRGTIYRLLAELDKNGRQWTPNRRTRFLVAKGIGDEDPTILWKGAPTKRVRRVAA